MEQAGSSVTIETTVSGDAGEDAVAVELQDSPSVAVYRRACGEARETIDQQIAWNREIDDKAARLLRINVALAALVVTALSLGLQYAPTDGSGPPQQVFQGAMNWYFAGGTALFVTSTALAGATYTMSSLKVGLQFDGFDETTDSELPVEEFYRELAMGYKAWVDHNRSVVNRNGTYVSFAIVLLVYSVVFFVVGVTNELGFGGIWRPFGLLLLLLVTMLVLKKSGRDLI